MCAFLVENYFVESAITMFTRNSYVYYTLPAIGESMEKTFNKIISPQLGDWFGPFAAKQLSSFYAVPVAIFMGDLAGTVVIESIKTVINIARSFFQNTEKKVYTWGNAIRDTAIKIIAWSTGFYATVIIQNFAMSQVRESLYKIVPHIAPLLPYSGAASLLISQIVLIVTPTLSFFVADLYGQGVYIAADATLRTCWQIVFG